MPNFTVKVNFNDGINNYDLPHVSKISDPKEGMKSTVIEGTRGDGSIIIPGGKKSQEISINGVLFDSDGYVDLTTAMNDMRTKVTTNVATLILKHWTGSTWAIDWSYTVRRTDSIDFDESLRTDSQPYSIRFLVIAY
jgi:hypothetical protein